jgi:hypothetical protein
MMKYLKVMGVLVGLVLLVGCSTTDNVKEQPQPIVSDYSATNLLECVSPTGEMDDRCVIAVIATILNSKPAPDVNRLPARIVPVDMIDALEQRDCMIRKVLYEEGRRTSKLEISCSQ